MDVQRGRDFLTGLQLAERLCHAHRRVRRTMLNGQRSVTLAVPTSQSTPRGEAASASALRIAHLLANVIRGALSGFYHHYYVLIDCIRLWSPT